MKYPFFTLLIMAILALQISLTAKASSKFQMSYSMLVSKDLDEMNSLALGKVRASKKASDENGIELKLAPLREGLRIVLARPNEDNLVEKTLPLLKPSLEELDAWDSSITALVNEAVQALKEPEDISPSDQTSYTVVLENVISEFKPESKRKSPFEFRIIELIANANIKVTKECRHERKIRMMKATTSPSSIAQAILEDIRKSDETSEEKPTRKKESKASPELLKEKNKEKNQEKNRGKTQENMQSKPAENADAKNKEIDKGLKKEKAAGVEKNKEEPKEDTENNSETE